MAGGFAIAGLSPSNRVLDEPLQASLLLSSVLPGCRLDDCRVPLVEYPSSLIKDILPSTFLAAKQASHEAEICSTLESPLRAFSRDDVSESNLVTKTGYT